MLITTLLVLFIWFGSGLIGYLIALRGWYNYFGNLEGAPGYWMAVIMACCGPGALFAGLGHWAGNLGRKSEYHRASRR